MNPLEIALALLADVVVPAATTMKLPEISLRLVAGVLLILANGFFVAIEFALTRARQFTEDEFVDGDARLERAWR